MLDLVGGCMGLKAAAAAAWDILQLLLGNILILLLPRLTASELLSL